MIENVIIYDIETMQECFIVVCMEPGKTPKSFTVSKWQNQLDAFVKYTDMDQEGKKYHKRQCSPPWARPYLKWSKTANAKLIPQSLHDC